ncbi:MAG TPA: tRNA (cytidine(34)-2'-O)-methyltransferase [Steroidobacteraceae bacterium]|jgi:tRNA (cytidine/uridine-2'-O-)-methyltransferase|nr:tRNA (cytidine(34)-2'-O)-methyltransferase [Steroidobacteraceae bacterium]
MIRIVLFEPEIPPNTGNVIRLCANTGAELHLVKPLGFRLDDKSLKRSALDYQDLAQVRVHADLDACLLALEGARFLAVETGGRRCYADVEFRTGDVLVFGPETRGLPPAVRARMGEENSIHIPMRGASRSLNLSNAVALVVYEAWRQMRFRLD